MYIRHDKTFLKQIEKYFKEYLKAITPDKAPNFTNLPSSDSQKSPSTTNTSTNPLFTLE